MGTNVDPGYVTTDRSSSEVEQNDTIPDSDFLHTRTRQENIPALNKLCKKKLAVLSPVSPNTRYFAWEPMYAEEGW